MNFSVSVFEVMGDALNLVAVSGPSIEEIEAAFLAKIEASLGKPELDDLRTKIERTAHHYSEEDDSGRSRKWARRCHNGYGHGPRFSRAVIRDREVRRQRLDKRWLVQNFDWFSSWGPPRPRPIDLFDLSAEDKRELEWIDRSLAEIDAVEARWHYEWLGRSYQNWIEKKRRAA